MQLEYNTRCLGIPVVAATLAIVATFATMLTACANRVTFTQKDDQAIRAVIDAQSAAWNKGEIEGFMAGYLQSPELVFTAGGDIERGWQPTLDRYKARYGNDTSSMGKLELDIIEIRALGGDGAVVLGRWQLTEAPRAGGGIFSLVFERRPEGWRIVHDHTSATREKTQE